MGIDHTIYPMICTCHDEGLAEARVEIEAASDELRTRGWKVEDGCLVDSILMSLAHDFEVAITGVSCDQWFRIQAQRGEATYSQDCDDVVAGFAALYNSISGRLSKARRHPSHPS